MVPLPPLLLLLGLGGAGESKRLAPEVHLTTCFPPSLQVVGLVTRKDLARYRLGKEGLEELSLAQT